MALRSYNKMGVEMKESNKEIKDRIRERTNFKRNSRIILVIITIGIIITSNFLFEETKPRRIEDVENYCASKGKKTIWVTAYGLFNGVPYKMFSCENDYNFSIYWLIIIILIALFVLFLMVSI